MTQISYPEFRDRKKRNSKLHGSELHRSFHPEPSETSMDTPWYTAKVVGGWTNPFVQYVQVKLHHFPPNIRGDKAKILETANQRFQSDS